MKKQERSLGGAAILAWDLESHLIPGDTPDGGGDEDRKHWSRVAGAWVVWARTPNHDAFRADCDALAAFVGRGNGDALDVGCGGECTAIRYRPIRPPHGVQRLDGHR